MQPFIAFKYLGTQKTPEWAALAKSSRHNKIEMGPDVKLATNRKCILHLWNLQWAPVFGC